MILKYFIFSNNFRAGLTYKGTVNKTKSGKTCQYWSHNTYDDNYKWVGIHNYCRNPRTVATHVIDKYFKTQPVSAWCFTTDPGTKWEYCDIRKCSECDEGEEYQPSGEGGTRSPPAMPQLLLSQKWPKRSGERPILGFWTLHSTFTK